MHACPDCGMACDCDQDDLWRDWPFYLDCVHECEEEDDDLYLDNDAWSSWIFDDEVNWYAGFAGTENRPGLAGDQLQHRREDSCGTLDT